MEIRRTARIVLLDPAGRVLLMKIIDDWLPPGSPGHGSGLWVTIGGGVGEHEDTRDAAQRELREETGLQVPVEPARWYGEQVLTVQGRQRLLKETFFVAHTDTGRIDPSGLDDDERSVVRAFAWWSAGDLLRTDEPFVPPILPDLVREVIDDPEPPDSPTTIDLQAAR